MAGFCLPFAKFFATLHPIKPSDMRKVIGIGETVLDIIFKGDQPIGAVPGGSVFTGIISLGRAGVDATFISEAGNDRVGRRIIDFLRQNGVNADNVNVYPGSKSPLSLAFLDEHNNAEYIFYKDHPHDRLDFAYPDVGRDDVVMFGSFYAVNPAIRPQVMGFIEYARSRGAIIYYDVNFRSSHRNDVIKITPNLLENLEYADIVRGSTDDFDVLFHKTDPDQIYRSEVAFYCKRFICTAGSGAVALRTGDGRGKDYPVEATDTVSTIGAGDNFNAGLIYGLLKYGIRYRDLPTVDEAAWDRIIRCGTDFAREVCQSFGNSVPAAFAQQYR